LVGISNVSAAIPTVLTPEQFGATGDGRTDDTPAFAAMSAFIIARGGGYVELQPKTYRVGRQVRNGHPRYAFAPLSIMNFVGCAAAVIVRGNGALLRCAPGLRYGTFDPATGRPIRHQMPYFGSEHPVASSDLASPYLAMINVEGCSGPVEITDVELDGNLRSAVIGGQYGDGGWQIPCSGIILRNNRSSEKLIGIYSHDHLQDGLTIDGSPEKENASELRDVVCEYNGRQGCSIVGGRAYSISRSKFSNTGRAGLASPPGAGLDIEAEGKTIRNLLFRDCEFSNNTGPGLIADSGDSAGAIFENCRFIGTTHWAAWPRKPRFKFANCQFVGAIVSAYGSSDPSRATTFSGCHFSDDPALSPTRRVYIPKPLLTIAELPNSPNVRFDHCEFDLTHRAVLPWSQSDVIYADCHMRQAAAKQSYPRGTFIGRNRIDGNVDLYSSRILGKVVVNGKLLPRRVVG
jgi:hypothetical protein